MCTTSVPTIYAEYSMEIILSWVFHLHIFELFVFFRRTKCLCFLVASSSGEAVERVSEGVSGDERRVTASLHHLALGTILLLFHSTDIPSASSLFTHYLLTLHYLPAYTDSL